MNRIESIFSSYRENFIDDFYWLPDIPEKKLANALNTYIVLDEDEQIICLYNNSAPGSAKKSLALSTKGIYWKELYEDSNYLCYCDIGKISVEGNDLYILSGKNGDLDDEFKLPFENSDFPGKLRKLLTEIFEYAKDSNMPNNTLEKGVESIIRSYQEKLTADDNFYWSPDIPEKKLANALSSYIILDEDEQLICLYDSTVFGSAKEGIALSAKGFYWKQLFESSNYLSYCDIEKISRKGNDLYILKEKDDNLDDGFKLTFSDSKWIGEFRKLLTEVFKYSKDNNMPSNTLEKRIKTTLLNDKLTEEEKQAILEQYQEEWEIEADEFESIVNKIASSIPFMRSARNVSFLNKVIGRQAFLDHKESKKLKSESEAKYKEYSDKTVAIQQDLNHSIEEYGRRKLETLKRTLGVFLSCLEKMEQRYKESYYELMDGCDFPKTYVAELGQLNMNNSELLKTAVTTGNLTYAAVAGVPIAVKSTVAYFAAASTGTAIESLSGAAASNAVMAWLGGGSIAAGGYGVAGGTIVLAGITYSVTSAVAIAATGLMASKIMAKKLTQAQEYSSEVDIACEKMETSWVTMAGIKQRVTELLDVTMNIYDKCIIQLAQLEPLVSNFDTHSKEHLLVFQKTALLITSMSELAKTPLFGDDMNLSGESEAVITKTRKVLNSEL